MQHFRLAAGDRSPLTILCVGAHSDDIEIGCGGTILQLAARRRVDVRWVVFSANDAREREARRGARRFLRRARSAEVTVHRFQDGFLPSAVADVKAIFEQMKAQCSPDIVFTHYRDDRHQDHRVLSDLCWNTFRDHCILEYEIPKYDGDLGTPNCFVPLTRAIARQKVRGLHEVFGTQRGKHWFADETFFGLMRLRGMECRAPDAYAEAFYGRKIVVGA
ncbi:MAG TPA: PIG-L deacetylase family protein [Vicinamibacterales bacterium]|jgi:LmbE family N-acetylglucosaminyl deacetylase